MPKPENKVFPSEEIIKIHNELKIADGKEPSGFSSYDGLAIAKYLDLESIKESKSAEQIDKELDELVAEDCCKKCFYPQLRPIEDTCKDKNCECHKEEKTLKFCEKCVQMTNHTKEKCLKCPKPKSEDWREELRKDTLYLNLAPSAQARIERMFEIVISKTKEATGMEYLYAFGNYVPLGSEDFEPEKMAKEVTDVWGEKTKEEERERVREIIEVERKNHPLDGKMIDAITYAKNWANPLAHKVLDDILSALDE